MQCLLGVILFVLAYGSSSQAATICDEDNLRRAASPSSRFSSTKELFTVTGARSNLHVFGEAHFYTDTVFIQRIISEIAPRLSGSKKCLFLELPKNGLALFARTFDEHARRTDLSPTEREKLRTWPRYYPSIVQAAESSGMRVFEIDHPDKDRLEIPEDDRNVAMATRAAELLANSTCDSAVFFVGKAHISPLENQLSVIERLRALGVKPITYNLADFSERSAPYAASWSGLTCSPRDVLPTAFRNADLLPSTRLYPRLPSERTPNWDDFDYSISR